jgi:hypothetical protein
MYEVEIKESLMKRLVVLLSLLLVTPSATADDPKQPQPVLKAPVAVKVVPKAPPIKAVPAAKAVVVLAKIVPTKAAPASQPAAAATPKVEAVASQPTSSPASQKLDVPKDTMQAASMAQQALQALQHKNWRHLSGLLIMLLIFFWRRYGEKLLALHKVPDRYMGLVVASVAVVYALGMALLTTGKFDWATFLSNALTSGGESFFAWECGGKFALEKTLGPPPAKLRQRAAVAAPAADATVKIEDDNPAAKDNKSA